MKKKMTSHPQPGKYSLRGFTVFELAIVLLISGVGTIAAMNIANQYMTHENIVNNNQRLNDIQTALNLYALTNYHLPHPANRALPQTNPCHGNGEGGGGCPAPAANISAAGGTVLIGALPVRDLSLPDSDYADVWGNQFIYAVSQPLTTGTAASPMNQVTGAKITIIDASGGSALTGPGPAYAMYVVDDPGQDGKGAYTVDGVANAIPCGFSPGYDNTNCGNTGTFRIASYSNANSAAHFDDQLLFATSLANTVYPVCPPNSGLTSSNGLSIVCTTMPSEPPPISPCTGNHIMSGNGLSGALAVFTCHTAPTYPPPPPILCGSGHRLAFDTITNTWSCPLQSPPPAMVLPPCATGVSGVDASGNYVCNTVSVTQNDTSCVMNTPQGGGYYGCQKSCGIDLVSGIQTSPTGAGIQATAALAPVGMSVIPWPGYGMNCMYIPGGCSSGGPGCDAVCHVTCLAPNIP